MPKRLRAVALLSVLFAGCSAVTFDTRDDFTISAQVKMALLDEPSVAGLRLGAETFQGVVTLSGTVPSPPDVDRAIAVARKVRGVKDVKSLLKVNPKP